MIQLASLWKSIVRRQLPWGVVTVVGVSSIVMGMVVGARSLGWFEIGELAAYDWGVRWKNAEPTAAPARPNRLLVVAITEADLNRLGTWPLPDRTIAKIIQKLTDNQASLIGLDIFRATPVNPGHADLVKIWDRNDLIIPACRHSTRRNPGIGGPPGIPAAQLGFVDLLVDRDSIVRRALLFMNRDRDSPCTSETSFALQLAQEYLLRQHNYQGSFDSQQQFHIAQASFRRLLGNEGGYQQAEAGGYQILIDYQSTDRIAPIVSMTDLLADRVDPNLIKNRIVVIGSTASSLKDEFLTPFSAGKAEDATIPGVLIHAQITNQILNNVLDRQPLWWFIPDWLEGIWIGGWCVTGSLLAWYVRHPARLLVVTGGAVIVLIGGFAIAFVQTGWLPIVSPLVGLIISSIGVLGLTSYRTQQQQQEMARLANNQEQTIAALQLLLRQTTPPTASPELPPTILPATTMAGVDRSTTLNQNLPPTPTVGSLPPNYSLAGRYQVESTLGSGGFGVTYVARDTKRPGQPQCVIKQLVPARRDPNFVNLARRLFNNEAEILSKLGHHPQIPHLLAYFEEQQEFYLVQEFIDGSTLAQEFEALIEPWSEAQVLDLFHQLLPVLSFIHSQYVIHRDLKPGNIIRDRQTGKLVLIDFGAVKELQPQLVEERDLTISIGTRGYTPPEQYAGKPNYSSDIYALGSIAIEALTNTHPRDLPVDDRTGNPIWRDLAIVTPALAQVLDKMVANRFVDRYQSAAAIAVDLPH
jgi:CHASE2 domain-containing sensor protein/tRNA A-37 threonylcarbamoyl transferase component Bud32